MTGGETTEQGLRPGGELKPDHAGGPGRAGDPSYGPLESAGWSTGANHPAITVLLPHLRGTGC